MYQMGVQISHHGKGQSFGGNGSVCRLIYRGNAKMAKPVRRPFGMINEVGPTIMFVY